MNTTARIKLGIVGCGRAGMIHARNFAFKIRESEITTLVDPSAENISAAVKELGLEDVKVFSNYEKALKESDFDAVVVSSPTVFHRDVCVASAFAGKHILCEKPLAMNLKECEEIAAAANKSKVKVQIGFMRRFDRGFMAAKERIDAGEIGNVVMVRSLTYGPSKPQAWMCDIAKSNGPLAEVNSHDIDTARWFTSSEFKELYAIGGNYRTPSARKEFPDFYDNVSLTAKFANGCQGIINGAQGVGYGYDSRCEILGTEGIIFVGALDGIAVVTCNKKGMSKPIVPSWRDLFLDAYFAEDRDFIDCIIEDRQPKVTVHDGMMAVKVVNAGNMSIRSGLPVKLNK